MSSEDLIPLDISFNNDGTTGDDINSLTTAFDVSTASFNQLFSVAAQDGTPSGMTFNDDGTKMYVTGDA